MPFLPVVDSCEFAILHQLVPEVGQALSGEHLYRVGLISWKSQNSRSVLYFGMRIGIGIGKVRTDLVLCIGIGIGIGKFEIADLPWVDPHPFGVESRLSSKNNSRLLNMLKGTSLT